METKNVFNLIAKIEQFKLEAYPFIVDAFDHYTDSVDILIDLNRKINEKQLTYVANTDICKTGMEQIKQDKPKQLEEVSNLFDNVEIGLKYSKWNTVVWIKRAYKTYEKLLNETYSYRKIAEVYLSELKALYAEIEHYKQHDRIIDYLPQLESYRKELLKIKSFELEFPIKFTSIENTLIFGGKVNVNDLLSMINVSKDKVTKSIIDTLPAEITIKKMYQLLFVDAIEDEDECFMNHLIMEDILECRKNNPEEARKMDMSIGLDMIPTFSVSCDGFGEVMEVKQNKPNLRLV